MPLSYFFRAASRLRSASSRPFAAASICRLAVSITRCALRTFCTTFCSRTVQVRLLRLEVELGHSPRASRRAVEDRIGEDEADPPVLEVVGEELIRRVEPVRVREDLRRLDELSVRIGREGLAGESGLAVARDQVELRKRLVLPELVAHLIRRDDEVLRHDLRTMLERAADAGRQVIWLPLDADLVGRDDRRGRRSGRLEVQRAPELVLRDAECTLRVDDVLLGRRDADLGLHDVDRGERADVDLDARDPVQLGRDADRLLLHRAGFRGAYTRSQYACSTVSIVTCTLRTNV